MVEVIFILDKSDCCQNRGVFNRVVLRRLTYIARIADPVDKSSPMDNMTRLDDFVSLVVEKSVGVFFPGVDGHVEAG